MSESEFVRFEPGGPCTELPARDRIGSERIRKRRSGGNGGRRVTEPRDAFDRVVGALNEAMLDDGRWPAAAGLLDEALGAKGHVLTFGEDLPGGDVEIWFSRSYCRGEDRSEWQREYFRDYYAEDEHLPRLRALRDSEIVLIAELFAEEERRTSRTYNEALLRFEAQNGLNVRLDGPGGSCIVWGIADPVGGTGWSSPQIEMIRRVLPHLRHYVRVRTALVDAQALGSTGAELLSATRVGVIQLDRSGRIAAANDSARELLRGNDGLRDHCGALRAATAADNAVLESMMRRALPRFGEPAAGGSMLVRRASLRPRFAVHVTPVKPTASGHRPRGVAALVLVVDPVARAQVDPGLVEAALGLSPTEAEIAMLLARGLTVRQVGAATGRRYGTVRTHLKHIFGKLGVSRQLEVVQVVLGLSSLPVSGD